MKELKIEWSHEWALHDTRGNAEEVDTQFILPVVRLEDVEAVLAEAVWAMKEVITRTEFACKRGAKQTTEELKADCLACPMYQRAEAFLASPLVAKHLKRMAEQRTQCSVSFPRPAHDFCRDIPFGQGRQKKRRSCNRHADCDEADRRGNASHCSADDCEDCFGQ